jgi:CRISPR system Cascade subunit CasB
MSQRDEPFNRTVGSLAASWWRRYCDPTDGDSAVRARLRRCHSSVEAATMPEALHLVRMLVPVGAKAPGDARKVDTALGLARVLAHVTQDSDTPPMRAAGWRSFPNETRGDTAVGAERPRLSEIRFRRLLLTGRGEEQVAAFTRLVRLLDGSVNVAALAEDFWYWNERTKKRWAFDYYAAAVAAPTVPHSREDA